MIKFLPKITSISPLTWVIVAATAVITSATGYGSWVTIQNARLTNDKKQLQQVNASQNAELTFLKDKIAELENEDQRLKNKQLADLMTQLKSSYRKSLAVYEDLVDLKAISKAQPKLDEAYASVVTFLINENYASAEAKLTQLSRDIATENAKMVVAAAPITANTPVSNTPPGSGYSRQVVKSGIGDYVVSLVSGDLGSTKVIVDTASDGDCGNDCPVLPLATYASRNGAFAGINGTYFCPAAYPTCAGKTNSFDLLVMNKNKKYINSDNNVYSNNPGVIFGGGYIRFISAVSQWGRDTGIDGMLSNYPLTVFNNNINFGGNDDPKQGSKGNRSFVGNKGNTVYIGVVHNVTVAESAHVLKALGMENALNLDSGGSTALYSGGYKVGPGRDIPNAIIFVKK